MNIKFMSIKQKLINKVRMIYMFNLLAKILADSKWNMRMLLLRKGLKWTQKEAAERCATNHRTYCNWENAVNTPRESSQKSIAKAFGVKVEDLFSDIPKKSIVLIIISSLINHLGNFS